jgi:hypothetical protein
VVHLAQAARALREYGGVPRHQDDRVRDLGDADRLTGHDGVGRADRDRAVLGGRRAVGRTGADLGGGRATLSVPDTGGASSVTATYSGDAFYNASNG